MRKVSLVDRVALRQYAKNELKALGFTESVNTKEHHGYDYYKQTDVGELCLTPVSDSNGLSLFAMFDDPKRASTKFNCNPYSGKYNYLFLKTKFEISNALCQYVVA